MRISLALLVLPCVAAAQQDTSKVSALNPVVVTAERAPAFIASTTSAVTRISAAELARTPQATLADALRRVPGIAVIDFDGLGFEPQLIVRGFYGGGEAEYVVVLVDGIPVNQLQTGLVTWSALPPLGAVEAIEVVRGSASALYGDAAVGGVINVITRKDGGRGGIRLNGNFSTFGGSSGDLAQSTGAGGATASAAFTRSDGFRQHSARTTESAQLSIPLTTNDVRSLRLNFATFNRNFSEPGPLIASLAAVERSASDVLFRFDHTRDRSYAAGLNGVRALGTGAHLRASLTGEYRENTAVRTLALAPGFGDTRQHDTDNVRGAATIQLDAGDSFLPGTDRLIVGAELGRGSLKSRYYGYGSGDRDEYATATGGRGARNAAGNGARATASVYEQYTLQAAPALRVSIGARFDWLSDEFTPNGAESVKASHSAFSPKLGVNLRYLQNDNGSGNVYVTASRSFKAPTLDQLFDQRPVPVPFPPFEITTSNTLLDPQRGTNVEAGVYHTATLTPSVHASVSVSAYQMDMKNELDFDVQQLRYVNIGSSRHRGIETGIVVNGANERSLFANYALQSATSRIGDNAGNQLKAIPRHTLSGGVSFSPMTALETGLIVTSVRGVHLDDANTVELPAYTRFDAHVSYTIKTYGIYLNVRNLLDAKYSSTGFLDPSGTGEAYFYPAAGRVIAVGLRSGW